MDMVGVEQSRKKKAQNNSCSVDVPENCIFDILVRLPVETLCSLRFVCKSWFEIISRPDFRNAHLHRSDTTTRGGLILITRVQNDIKFMEFKDGKSRTKCYKQALEGKIRAACNGLIVLERYPQTPGLILHNPVTRELEDIPVGTISSPQFLDSYGLAFCHTSRRYKLLHLFAKVELTSLGCEIMDIGSGSWRALDVPPTKCLYTLQNPIFVLGALLWIQGGDRGQCMGSMSLDDEKFKIMAIPKTREGYYFVNSVFAMGEFLGYAGLLQSSNKIGLWILRGLGGECGWEKQYDIDIASGMAKKMTNLLWYGGDTGHEFIFKCNGDGFYAYDHDSHPQHMRKIEVIGNVVDSNIPPFWKTFPHVNSLVSWRS